MQEFTIKLTAQELKTLLNVLENEQRRYFEDQKKEIYGSPKKGNIWKATIALDAEIEIADLANTIKRQVNEGNCYK